MSDRDLFLKLAFYLGADGNFFQVLGMVVNFFWWKMRLPL
jgi:hypothetical protein